MGEKEPAVELAAYNGNPKRDAYVAGYQAAMAYIRSKHGAEDFDAKVDPEGRYWSTECTLDKVVHMAAGYADMIDEIDHPREEAAKVGEAGDNEESGWEGEPSTGALRPEFECFSTGRMFEMKQADRRNRMLAMLGGVGVGIVVMLVVATVVNLVGA